MTLPLPDDPALAAFTEQDIRLDLGCAWVSAGRISRSIAARMAGMERDEFDAELALRRIPSYTEEMLAADMIALETLFPKK